MALTSFFYGSKTTGEKEYQIGGKK